MGQGQVHEPIRPRRLERRERVELLEALPVLAEGEVQVGEFLAGRSEGGVELNRTCQRTQRLGIALAVVEAHREQIVRLEHAIVERDGAPNGIESQRRLPLTVAGQRKLVEHPWCAVIDRQVAAIVDGSLLVAAHGGIDVAEQFQRARGCRVDDRGLAEVTKGCRQFAPPPVAVAPFEVRQHGVALERERAAEVLDGLERLVAGQRRVAGRHETAELSLLPNGVERQHQADERSRTAQTGQDPAFHRGNGHSGTGGRGIERGRNQGRSGGV